MITNITGKLVSVGVCQVILEVGSVTLEIQISPHFAESLSGTPAGEPLSLRTHLHLSSDHSAVVPILFGFQSEAEKEFFLLLVSNTSLGPRRALKALACPVAQFAKAIEIGDVRFLRTLPGLGEAKAKEVAAKLSGKVGRFVKATEEVAPRGPHVEDLEELAVAALVRLHYKRGEAIAMVRSARVRRPDIDTVADLLAEAFTR